MALVAGTERFENFSKSANIGFASLQDIKNSDVYNATTNKLNEISTSLKDMVNGLTQSVRTPLREVNSQIDEAARVVKDTFSTLEDYTNFSPKDIEDAVFDFLPDEPVIKNAFRNLSAQCRNTAMSNVPGFKRYNDTAACGSPGEGACSSGQVSGFLDKFTNGTISKVARSLNSMLRSLYSLANMGYSAGLCKIFAALANGMPNSILQRGAAGVLAVVGGKGNATAVMDIATSLIGKPVNPSREISGLVGRITDNFKTPSNIKESQLGSLYTGMTSSYDTINPGYDRSEDGLYSLASMGSTLSNSDYRKSAGAFLGEDAASAAFDTPYTPSGYEPAVAYISGRHYANVGTPGSMDAFYIR